MPKNEKIADIPEQCMACKRHIESCSIVPNPDNNCDDFLCKENYCEECFEPLQLNGYELWCSNCGVIEDIRNNQSEDSLEENGIDYSQYPSDNDGCKCNECHNQYCQMKLKQPKKDEAL
jgi:hypothetical protein